MSIRVLLVDDSPPFLEAARRFLSSDSELGVIGTALSGSEALERAGELRPDVVVMDLAMPGMNGLEATRRLKEQTDAPRVIILTLHDNSEYRNAAEGAGADGFVAKSDLCEELLSLIHRLSHTETGSAPMVQSGTPDPGGAVENQ